MILDLRRDVITEGWTSGALYLDRKWLAWTLEDPVREMIDSQGRWYWRPEFKVKGKTAIPGGRYRLGLHQSPKFKRTLPHVLDVPDFAWILIHGGNGVDDTEGCILAGMRRSIDTGRLEDCAPAVEKLVSMLQVALPAQPVYLEVKQP